MSEKKKKAPSYTNEKRWKFDCRLALHQRLCWLIFAALAVGGGLLIMTFAPQSVSAYATIALALILMIGYQWAAQSPNRALNGWAFRNNEKTIAPQDALDYLDLLEKKLPTMKKKEMAFRLTEMRGFLLFLTGKQQEAIALLEGFDRCWDQDQRQRLAEHIRLFKEKTAKTDEEKEENS